MLVAGVAGTTLIGAYGIQEIPPTEEQAVTGPAVPAEPAVAILPVISDTPRRPVTLTLATTPEVVATPTASEVQPESPGTPAEPVVTAPAVIAPIAEPAAPITDPVTPPAPTEPTPDQTPATDTTVSELTSQETQEPSATIVGDTLAPESVLTTDLPVGARKAVPETKLTLTATDPAGLGGSGSGVARIEYRVNGADWTAYSTPFELREVMGRIERGSLTIGYRAIDWQGNVETERTSGFEVQPALSVSARLLTVPRVLCWWNEQPIRSRGRGDPST